METSLADGPLGGLRVLDLTSVIMGPFATHILADLGADVIKIESPAGDSLRAYRPNRHAGMSGNILNLHRNKRSVVLDLKRPACREALDRMIGTADAFIHNLRPAVMARAGYGYERVRTLRPDIIYCGAYGFGEAGPYRDKPAYDDLIQAGSGIAALFGAVRGEPAYAPTVLCDKLSGQAIAYSVMAALLGRARGGGGCAIEVPMFETTIEFTLVEHNVASAFEPPLGPVGFARLMSAERRPFRTADGYACILPYSDRNWREFYEFVGRGEFLDDPRFRTLGDRVQHIPLLYGMIAEEAPKHSTAEWVAFCDRANIPCMPVMSLDALREDPHVAAVGLFGVAEHPSEGAYRTVRRPVNFSNDAFRIRRHAPRLGEHTEALMREIGMSETATAEVLQAGGGTE